MDSTNSPQSLEQSGAIGGTTAGQQQAIFGQVVAEQTLIAYHGDHAVKLKYIGRVIAHQEADELIHGIYWEGGKGCAIGCTVHSDDHAAYETDLGMPEWFARLEDAIFEGMSRAASCRFPLRLLSAIPVGFAEWDRLYHEFCAYVLRDICEFDRMGYSNVAVAVDAIARLHKRWTETDDQAWKAAGSAARSAADSAMSASQSAADSAAESAAMSAADSAAMSASQSAADSAAMSARDSAALAARSTSGLAALSTAYLTVQAAESAAYDRMGDWLVRRFAASSGPD